MKMKRNTIAFLLATLIGVNTLIPPVVSAAGIVENKLVVESSKNVVQEESLEEFFDILLNTPDEFLENATEFELLEYFNEQSKEIEFKLKKDLYNQNGGYEIQGWWENTKCGAAIVLAVGGSFFIGSQLLKLKRYVTAIGGAKEAAYLVYLYLVERTIPDNLGSTVWNSVMNIATMVLGIDEIKAQCDGVLF